MKKILLSLVTALSLVTVPLAANAQQAQTPTAQGITIPVTGATLPGVVPAGTFTGTFDLQRFAVRDGAVVAIGTLVGTVTNTATGVVTSIVRTIALPVTTQATCDILHLELGPLDLDLLGLQIHLNQIVLDIDAQAGPGNLLGNLLCAVAGLLDNPNGLARLLNQILAILG